MYPIYPYVSLAEYGLRLFTVWAVSSRVAGVIPSNWKQTDPEVSMPVYSPWYQTFKFIFRFKNLVDLASILPSYSSYFSDSNTNTNFVRTLRLLRLVRVLRLMKLMSFLKNVDVAIDLILATLTQASLMLSVFLFFVMIIVILFGCLIYLAEQGKEGEVFDLRLYSYLTLPSLSPTPACTLTHTHPLTPFPFLPCLSMKVLLR